MIARCSASGRYPQHPEERQDRRHGSHRADEGKGQNRSSKGEGCSSASDEHGQFPTKGFRFCMQIFARDYQNEEVARMRIVARCGQLLLMSCGFNTTPTSGLEPA